MNNKYNIKLSNGRIIGPISLSEVIQLIRKKHIVGEEKAQIHPSESWLPITEIKEIESEIIRYLAGKERLKPDTDNTYIDLKISERLRHDIQGDKNKKDDLAEFKFERKEHTELSTVKEDADKSKESLGETVSLESEIVDEDKTSIISLDNIVPAIRKEAEKFEEEIVSKNVVVDKEEKIHSDEVEPIKEKRKKPLLLVVMVLVLFYLFFLDDEKPRVEVPKRVVISFPLLQEYANEDLSKKLFEQGLEEYKKSNYLSLKKASEKFKKSVEHNVKNKDSINYLLLTYADLYSSALDKNQARRSIYNLLQFTKDKILSDSMTNLAISRFYYNEKRYETARKTIENYLRLKNTPTIEQLALYLKIQLNIGNFDKAKDVYSKLSTVQATRETYLAFVEFHYHNDNYSEAINVIQEAIKKYPRSIEMYLWLLRLTQYKANKTNVKQLIKVVTPMVPLMSPVEFSQYYEFLGMQQAKAGNIKQAAKLFKVSLKISQNDELVSTLSNLEIGGDELTQNLIAESKVKKLIENSKREVQNKNWSEAIKLAVDAADLLPRYIPGQVYLANLQVKRGFFNSAISNLERLSKLYPTNYTIKNSLVRAYIKTRQFEEAERVVVGLSQTKFVTTPAFSSLRGELFHAKGNVFLAIKWIRETIKRNPMDIDSYYLLADIFLEHKKFDQSLSLIERALELDPKNLRYNIHVSKILYEKEGARASTGYLRNLLKEYPFSAELLGEIVKNYYRNGQLKEFEYYQKKLEQLPVKDASFYRFMVQSAILQDNVDQIKRYSQKLIETDPSDFATKIELINTYIKISKFDLALKLTNDILNKLPDYPNANYFKAYILMKKGKLDEALVYAQKEVEKNPEIEQGFYILGEIYRQKKDYNKSINSLEKSLSLNGKNFNALVSLGWIKFHQNDFEQAREYYLRATKLRPTDPEVHKQLGFIYQKSGQSRLAEEYFQLYLDLYPNAPDHQAIKGIIDSMRQ